MSVRKKILLLNPPGKNIYSRDYYCSKFAKINTIGPQIDLLILSGILTDFHDLLVYDAMVQGKTKEKCLDEILLLDFEIVIFMTGAVSWKEDFDFLDKIKKAKNSILIGSGDIFMENGRHWLEKYPILDAIILGFANDDILKFLEGQKEIINNIIYRDKDLIVEGEKIISNEPLKFSNPRHALFPIKKYNLPFARSLPFAPILTDYGCPYKCSFCLTGELGFRLRSVEDVVNEMKLIKSLNIKEIAFSDQTFGVKKSRTEDLLKTMINEKFNFRWTCFSRVDVLDEETLMLMKKAGCHTIIFGVESGNDKTLKKARKVYTTEQIKNTFLLCHKIKIDTVGTFIIGLPEEDEKDINNTIIFAKDIKATYASFNVIVPRMGTKLRADSIEKGFFKNNEDMEMDQSGSYSVMGNEFLTSTQILKLKNKAIVKFYFRPSYIIARIIKSFLDETFLRSVKSGILLIKDFLKNK